MRLQFDEASGFDRFQEELAGRLKSRDVRSIERPDLRASAVMMLLMNKEGEAHVLLTKRTEKVTTHKGQISLPGGKYDGGDGTLLDTAYRETCEEVGIGREKITYLGRFDDFISLFGFHIATFVGTISYPQEYRINADEIDEYIEVPLRIFQDREYHKIQYYEHEGHEYKVYHYLFDRFEIWGLTARILTDFAAKVLQDCQER